MASCFQLGDSLEVDGFGDLQTRLATDSGLEIIAGVGGGLSLTDDQKAPVWQSYTPVLISNTTNWTIGNGSALGRYIQIGKLIIATFQLTVGSTSSIPAGQLFVSVPVDADTTLMPSSVPAGRVQAVNASTANSVGSAFFNNASKVSLFYDIYNSTVNTGPTTAISNTAPFTAGTGDIYAGMIEYISV